MHKEALLEAAPLGQDTNRSQSATKGESNQRLEEIVTELLLELGVDIREPHFRGTPARVARLYRELTRGYGINPAEILKTFPSDHQELEVIS